MNIKYIISGLPLLMGVINGVFAFQQVPVYVKLGPDYFWSQSSNYSFTRINPIPGTLEPSINRGSLNRGNWAGNFAAGFTRQLSTLWQLSPEVSYFQLGNYTKSHNPFMIGPYEGTDIINTLHTKLESNVVAGILNIEYLVNKKYSVYAAPGLGAANIRTKNSLSYQSNEDDTYLLMKSNKNRSNFSPQISAGIRYAALSNIFIDLGVNYIWLGKIPFGTFSRDEDDFTETNVFAKNAYLLGPKLNFIFYFG